MNKTLRFFTFFCLALSMAWMTACKDDETEIGYNLQDPSTYYNGVLDTAFMKAYTFYEDSLQTSGAPNPYSSAVLGNYSDGVFGKVSVMFYTQIAAASEGGINIDPSTTTIDSVVLSLRILDWYPGTPDSSASFNLHFEVRQLAEMLQSDSNYYASDEIPVEPSALYSQTIVCHERDSMVNLRLSSSVNAIFTRQCTSEEFLEHAKGLRIRLMPDSDPCAPTLNLAAAHTKICVYYTYNGLRDSVDFLCGTGTNHFSHIEHTYSGTPFSTFASNPKDSINGGTYLYLEPLGGTKIKLDLNDFIRDFRLAHPYAIIHHAELLLPKADIADDEPPARILAYKHAAGGYEAPIPDLLNEYYGDVSGGFDGRFHADKGCYRLRVTRHLQQLMRTGVDYGTTLYIDARRSSAARTVINGTQSSDPIRIEFIYSESNYQN